MRSLEELQAEATHEGRRCAVGALIFDPLGRVFVHRRGWDRRFLPGCWDVVGGHVEPGEGLLGALAREVEEETGWRMRGTPTLVHVVDWETQEPSGPDRRREFDFLVDVEGDLARPRLERPKHVEFRWVGPDETAILDENRGADDGVVRRIVEIALASRRGQ
jgi:8-oxo-dGTP diphosphatase